MRFLCLCSVLVLAACGGRSAARDPFAYDTHQSLQLRDEGVIASGPKEVVRALSYAGDGGRVEAFIAAPRTGGRYAAVLFLHGSGGSRTDFLGPAAQLASKGAVAMTISEPIDAVTYRPLIVDARRALDVLVSRRDVDAHRLGVVGYSLGGQIAAILAGDERRLADAGIIAGRGNATTVFWIRRARCRLFFEAGKYDEVVPHSQLVALIRAAPDTPRVRWYPTGHGMDQKAMDDQLAWQAKVLSVG